MVKRHRSASMKIELIQQNLLLPLACSSPIQQKKKHPPPFSHVRPTFFIYFPAPSRLHPLPQPHQPPCPHLKKACKFQVHTFLLMIYCPGAEFHLLPLPFAEPVASQ